MFLRAKLKTVFLPKPRLPPVITAILLLIMFTFCFEVIVSNQYIYTAKPDKPCKIELTVRK
ncbi:hypothetical protein NCCP2140_19580 [Pseudoalteromonas sp. NCCP-2140]|nr:hypothetical protein NCCP2140_19580 [Pseudoalteromonas sp. NCCP-2140]